MSQKSIDWQGHRGCRGLMPENTIPAFLKAVDLGVMTLELDVIISKDRKVIVSHEPWISHVICSHPDGSPVGESEAMGLNLYQMSKAEIQSYDAGLRAHPKFPDQEKLQVYKPSLDEVVIVVKKHCDEKKLQMPKFNIELKSNSKGYNLYMPEPKNFSELVVEKIRNLNIESSTTLQSFDINVLEELNKIKDRNFEISYLVQNIKGLKKNLAKLSFIPEIFSPYYKGLGKGKIKKIHKVGMKVIPWTVNTQKAMQKLINKGVDGIITDYPNLKIIQETSS